MVIDLSTVGLGRRPTDPVSPPAGWAGVHTSARTMLKACRVVTEVESMARGLGLPPYELVRLRPLLLVLEAAVYDWDQQVEDEQHGAGPGSDRGVRPDHGAVILELVADIVALDDGMRADIDGLRQLFRSETRALQTVSEAGPEPAAAGVQPRPADLRLAERKNEELFAEVSRWRSSDLRLLLRVISTLAGWPGAQLVELLQPCLELMEIEDDLKTAVEDRRSGSYNSFWFLRSVRSAQATQDYLDAVAAERTEDLGRRLRQAPPEVFRRAFVMLCCPRSWSEQMVITQLSRLPRRVVERVVQHVLLPRLRALFSTYWQRPEFQDGASGQAKPHG
jgi:hypothetical protein